MDRPWWGSISVAFYVVVFHVQGAPPALGMGNFFLVSIHLALAVLAFYLKNK
jgi:hypothetical protein